MEEGIGSSFLIVYMNFILNKFLIFSLFIILTFSCAKKISEFDQIEVAGLNDNSDNIITISTYKYYNTKTSITNIGQSDYWLRCFIEKDSKDYSYQLYVHFNSFEYIYWDKATLKINNKLKNIEIDLIENYADCLDYGCAHYEDVIMPVSDDMLKDWSINGKKIRFSSSKYSYIKDIQIDSLEVIDFIEQVNKIKMNLK